MLRSVLIVGLTSLLLASCSSTLHIPPPPADLSLGCSIPTIQEGQLMVDVIGENRVELKKCADRLHRFQKFYGELH